MTNRKFRSHSEKDYKYGYSSAYLAAFRAYSFAFLTDNTQMMKSQLNRVVRLGPTISDLAACNQVDGICSAAASHLVSKTFK